MNYVNNDPDIIDMDTHELYIVWSDGYPFATNREAEEVPLNRDMELELMAAKIERESDLLKALKNLQHFTFIDRWAMKGLDGDAQSMYDEAKAAIAKATQP